MISKEFNRLHEIISRLENEAKMNELNCESKCAKIFELNDEIKSLKIKATNLESEVARVKDPMIAGPNELFNRNVETFLASLKI